MREGASKKPRRNIFVVFLFAGLGVFFDGGLTIFYNAFEKDGKIQKFCAEKKMRSWGEVYKHAFLMCIFACDRTTYNPKDTSLPRYIPYANDVSSVANRLQATKDQINDLNRVLKFLEKT